MSAATLIRWSGVALLAAGILHFLSEILHPGGGDPPTAAAVLGSPYAALHTLAIVSIVLVLLGLVGLYARLAAVAGWPGLVGFLASFAGYALLMGVVFYDAYVTPALARNAPALLDRTSPLLAGPTFLIPTILAGMLILVGLLVFGVAIMRAGVLPRWAGLVLAIGGLLLGPGTALPHPVFLLGALLVDAALAWLGFALWADRPGVPAAAPQPAPAR
jgi:hypothetical protein